MLRGSMVVNFRNFLATVFVSKRKHRSRLKLEWLRPTASAPHRLSSLKLSPHTPSPVRRFNSLRILLVNVRCVHMHDHAMSWRGLCLYFVAALPHVHPPRWKAAARL